MALISLLLVTLIFAVVFLSSNAIFSICEELKKCLKQVQQAAQTHSLGGLLGHFRKYVVVLKMLYYMYVEAIPSYEAAERMMDVLGKSFTLKFPFMSEYLITSDPVHARRLMTDPTWPDRVPADYYIHATAFNKPYGLFFGGGKSWKIASRITGKLLQSLGFYNCVKMESCFEFEMQELVRQFELKMAMNGGEYTFCPRHIFSHSSFNTTLYILLGKRDLFDEAVAIKLIKHFRKSTTSMSFGWTALEFVPFLKHFPSLTFLKSFHDMSNIVYDVLREVIAEKRKSGKNKEHIGDFVDGMLQYVDKSGNCEEGLTEENMLVVLRDLLNAGVNTTSSMLEYAFLYVVLHPEVQEKVQAEIMDIIGADRAPVYQDLQRMPYTQAVLNEVYRVGTPVPGVARAKQDSTGCTIALISVYGINRNELYYDEPDKFKPERFLSKEDPAQVVKAENLMPFGYGRRSCPAERTARLAVFMYFVGMLQKYSLKLSSHHLPPSMKNTSGMARFPPAYHITVKKLR